jgi:hypothetical protein
VRGRWDAQRRDQRPAAPTLRLVLESLGVKIENSKLKEDPTMFILANTFCAMEREIQELRDKSASVERILNTWKELQKFEESREIAKQRLGGER